MLFRSYADGEMSIHELKQIKAHAEWILEMLKPDTDMPEWVQAKITLAADYLSTACDYLHVEMNEELTAEKQFDLIEEMIEEMAAENNLDVEQVWENIKDFTDEELIEACTCWQGYKRKPGTEPCEKGSCVKEEEMSEGATADAKGYKSKTGGLTQKGRDHYNNTTGSHLKAPVTTPPSKLKKGSKAANRRKSFCARMGGMEGPMRKPNGEPTRKALALRKWNC